MSSQKQACVQGDLEIKIRGKSTFMAMIVALGSISSTHLQAEASNKGKPIAEEYPRYLHVMLGRLELDDEEFGFLEPGGEVDGRLDDTVPYLGASLQSPSRDGLFGYGWEGGGFVSWNSDIVSSAFKSDENGARLALEIDTGYYAFETFLGAYLSTEPVSGWRTYVGGGPLIMMALIDNDRDDESPGNEDNDGGRFVGGAGQGANLIIDFSDTDFDITAGYYARAGTEINVGGRMSMGLSVRYINAELSFSDSIGDIDLDGTTVLFTVGARL